MTDLERLLEAEARLSEFFAELGVSAGENLHITRKDAAEATDVLFAHLRPALERAQRIEDAAQEFLEANDAAASAARRLNHALNARRGNRYCAPFIRGANRPPCRPSRKRGG